MAVSASLFTNAEFIEIHFLQKNDDRRFLMNLSFESKHLQVKDLELSALYDSLVDTMYSGNKLYYFKLNSRFESMEPVCTGQHKKFIDFARLLIHI